MPTPDTAGRVHSAIAEEERLHPRVQRPKLAIGRRRAATPAGALGVGQQPLLPDHDWMLQLVDFDAVAEKRSAIARTAHRQPAVLDRAPRSTGPRQDQLVDERSPAVSRVVAGDHRNRGRETQADLGHAVSGGELGDSALDSVGQTVEDVGGGNGTAGRVPRDPDDAVLPQQDLDPPRAAAVGRDMVVNAVEDADQDCGPGRRLAEVEAAWETVQVVAK